jgi:hypothetical protein
MKRANIFNHSDQVHLIPSFNIVFERCNKIRFLTLDINFLNKTAYLTIKLR